MLGEGFLGFNIQYIEVLQITKQFDSFYQMVEEKKERIQEEVKRLYAIFSDSFSLQTYFFIKISFYQQSDNLPLFITQSMCNSDTLTL